VDSVRNRQRTSWRIGARSDVVCCEYAWEFGEADVRTEPADATRRAARITGRNRAARLASPPDMLAATPSASAVPSCSALLRNALQAIGTHRS
jgi:hypothetical protein